MSEKNNSELLDVNSHFAFGKNWSSYAQLIGEAQIAEAERSMRLLLPDGSLANKRLIDIGCGSGVHVLAALRLGAREIVAIDIDPDSVATTRALLCRFAPYAPVTVRQMSVFDLDAENLGHFDVVYSWGVLHHTGDLAHALRKAASLVSSDGVFAFALYGKTWLCWAWKIEKRWYARAAPPTQKLVRGVYLISFRIGLLITGRGYSAYVNNYKKRRGMDFSHDVHDWLGGWPYESISETEVEIIMQEMAMTRVLFFNPLRRWSRLFGRGHGIFGSGVTEYVFRNSIKWADKSTPDDKSIQ